MRFMKWEQEQKILEKRFGTEEQRRAKRKEYQRRSYERNHGYMIIYKGKTIRSNKQKTGVCNLCRAVVGIDCKVTQLHHEKYDDNNPSAHTIEVCPKCHIHLGPLLK